MATGYTYKIKDGITFKQFIMECSKAFGACISLRDSNNEIPEEFPVSTYHLEQLEIYNKKLEDFKKMIKDDYEKEAQNLYDKNIEYYEKSIKEDALVKQKYEQMLQKVKEWEPPTSNHVHLKDFMIQQITDSIKFDFHLREKPIKLSGKDWAKEEIKKILYDIEYHSKHYKEDLEITERNNKWINELRNSLKEED